MRYRVKEECGLCGKTLLLRPHLKKAHQAKTWDEYVLNLKNSREERSFKKGQLMKRKLPLEDYILY